MVKSIFKFNLETTDSQTVIMPKGAEILTIQNQHEDAELWALVDSNAPLEERIIEIFGTGHPVHCDMGVERKYIATYQLSGGNYIFHAFERLS